MPPQLREMEKTLRMCPGAVFETSCRELAYQRACEYWVIHEVEQQTRPTPQTPNLKLKIAAAGQGCGVLLSRTRPPYCHPFSRIGHEYQ